MQSDENNNARREFLRQGAALAGGAAVSLVPEAVRAVAWAAGSDAPELEEVRIGFIPLTDCASVILGRYENGLGRAWIDPAPMRFHADGAVNFPYLSDGMWFLTQFKRWGLVAEHPDYADVAAAVNRIDLYREAASAAGVPLPSDPMRTARFIDGVVWTGLSPAEFAPSQATPAPEPHPLRQGATPT